jgi:hypothetical protein
MKAIILSLSVLCVFVFSSLAQTQQTPEQTPAANPPVARVTLLDGSQQEWEQVEFVYASGKTVPRFEYVAGSFGSMVIADRVQPQPGVWIKAEYSNELKFKNLVLTAKPEIENRLIGTKCAGAECVEKGVRVRGTCRTAGQAKQCSAYLVPPSNGAVTDKADFISEISFVAR